MFVYRSQKLFSVRPSRFKLTGGLWKNCRYAALGAFPGGAHYVDSGPSGYVNLLQNGASVTPGLFNDQRPATDFNGTSQYCELSTDVTPPAGPFTVSAWLYNQNVGISSALGLFVDSATRFYLGVDGTAIYSGVGSKIYTTTSNAVPSDQWTHVTWVYDGSDQLDIYKNGSSFDTSTGHTYSKATAIGPWIGGRNRDGTKTYWNGRLADVCIFHGEMKTLEEIGILADPQDFMFRSTLVGLSETYRAGKPETPTTNRRSIFKSRIIRGAA